MTLACSGSIAQVDVRLFGYRQSAFHSLQQSVEHLRQCRCRDAGATCGRVARAGTQRDELRAHRVARRSQHAQALQSIRDDGRIGIISC